MKYKYWETEVCYFKAEKAEENQVEYLLLETDRDPNPDLEESPSLGIAHQDHVSSEEEEEEEERCPLHQVSLPLIDIDKLCQYQQESSNSSNITWSLCPT